MPDFSAVKAKAARMRIDIVEMIAEAGSGHPGGSLSAADIVATLYFGDVLRHDSAQPDWPERDRFILSKGHAAPVLYAALAEAGYFGRDHLRDAAQARLDPAGSPRLQARRRASRSRPARSVRGSRSRPASPPDCAAARCPSRARRPHGLLPARRRRAAGGPGVGGGDVRGARGTRQPRGDRRRQRPADRRRVQRGHVPRRHRRQVLGVRLARRPRSTATTSRRSARRCSRRKAHAGGPAVVVAHTVKGKGVSFMEGEAGWHGKAPSRRGDRAARSPSCRR